MRKFFPRLLLSGLIISNLFLCQSVAQIGITEELLTLSNFRGLPQFVENSDVYQISSYDTTGGNDDGFSGKFSFLRIENDNLIIADLKGSGVIQRIWTPTPSDDTIQFFFDGERLPRISLKFIDLFTGNVFPFLKPIVGNEIGGYYCYLPVPYKNGCKIVFKGKRMQFIQIQYRKNTGQRSVESYPVDFSDKERNALSKALGAWSLNGNDVTGTSFNDLSGIKSRIVTLTLNSGEIKSFFNTKKGGTILGFELIPQSDLSNDQKGIFLRARWNDEKVDAINCPVIDFFGYAFGKTSMQSLLLGVNNKIHYCYFPMPFDKRAELELVYLQIGENRPNPVTFICKVYYSEVTRQTDEGKFYVKWNREIDPEKGKPYTILNTEGKGHYVGTILQAQGLKPGMTIFFEGDDQCMIDGSLRLHGTGSEDYFNGGWYALPDRWDQGYSLPVHGALAYSIPLARTGGYRFYIPDKLSFSKSFSLTIEHGPVGNEIPVDYTSVAFYYSDRPPNENMTPRKEMLTEIKPPSTMEYWLALLPIKAFSNGSAISTERMSDNNTKISYDVLRFSSRHNGFIKFELDVPAGGEYKLFMSYFKGKNCSSFQVNQRQIPISNIIDGYSEEYVLVEKDYIGTLFVKNGTNTITVVIKENAGAEGRKEFVLHRLYLEKEQ